MQVSCISTCKDGNAAGKQEQPSSCMDGNKSGQVGFDPLTRVGSKNCDLTWPDSGHPLWDGWPQAGSGRIRTPLIRAGSSQLKFDPTRPLTTWPDESCQPDASYFCGRWYSSTGVWIVSFFVPLHLFYRRKIQWIPCILTFHSPEHE